MLGEKLRIGDVLLIAVLQENREWGFNPAPDGTEVKLVGWSETTYGHIDN